MDKVHGKEERERWRRTDARITCMERKKEKARKLKVHERERKKKMHE
jgi:hypothetical protein